jgi:hypothetical protein
MNKYIKCISVILLLSAMAYGWQDDGPYTHIDNDPVPIHGGHTAHCF